MVQCIKVLQQRPSGKKPLIPKLQARGITLKVFTKLGSGCDSVGRAVVSDARGPGSHPVIGKLLNQTFICLLSTTLLKKTKIRKKRPEMAHLKKYLPKCSTWKWQFF